MKKIIFSTLMLSLVLLSSSCSKKEIEDTASVKMAGEWYVLVQAIDNKGKVLDEDFFGYGHIILKTFNTAADNPSVMWIMDDFEDSYFPYQVKINTDQASMTFSAENAQNLFPSKDDDGKTYYNNITITNGKIEFNGATTPSGMKADKIEFDIEFDDDPYPAYYGFSKYRVSGYRYTGFVNDLD